MLIIMAIVGQMTLVRAGIPTNDHFGTPRRTDHLITGRNI